MTAICHAQHQTHHPAKSFDYDLSHPRQSGYDRRIGAKTIRANDGQTTPCTGGAWSPNGFIGRPVHAVDV